jgi:tetratricopeptide (TPR) repeat protein
MLPAYCGGPGAGGVDWNRVLGPERLWNNHTCYGINRINRYYRAKSPGERAYHLQVALQDFNYSVDHLPDHFPLMPEIYYYRGLVRKLRGEPAKAVADWLETLKRDRHYVKAILGLADLYAEQMKKPEEALKWVTEGLRDNPDSKALQDRYTRLGGKLPYPAPRQPEPAARTHAAQGEPAPGAPAGGQAPTAATTPAPTAAATAAQPSADQAVSPVLGTVNNPWCRFCPEPAPAKGPGPSKP